MKTANKMCISMLIAGLCFSIYSNANAGEKYMTKVEGQKIEARIDARFYELKMKDKPANKEEAKYTDCFDVSQLKYDEMIDEYPLLKDDEAFQDEIMRSYRRACEDWQCKSDYCPIL